MKLSIIIPVYNVSKYLKRCIDSIVDQETDETDYEIVLIDDGSTDNSGTLCDAISSKYNNVRVMHKHNEGLGLTRNVGIMEAFGDYLIFVDSDDFINKDAIQAILKETEKDFDVSFFKHSLFTSNKICHSGEKYEHVNGLTKKDFIGLCLGEPLRSDELIIGPAWKAIYKRDFLIDKKILFESERVVLSEDYIFSAKVCALAEKISFLDKEIYVYCDNPGSLTNSYREDRYKKAVYLYERMEAYIKEYNLDENARNRAFNNYLINILVSIKHICFFEQFNYRKKINEIEKICIDKRVRDILLENNYCDSFKLKLLKESIKHNMKRLIYFMIKARY